MAENSARTRLYGRVIKSGQWTEDLTMFLPQVGRQVRLEQRPFGVEAAS